MNARQSIGSDPALGEQSSATAGHVLVVGLGDTGLSCIRHLSESHRRVVAVDSRERPPRRAAVESEFPGVEVHCGRFDTPLFESAEEIVVSPGLSAHEPALQAAAIRGIPVIGDIELFARAADAPVVAITGSNGKSTVTSLFAAMAQCAGLRVGVGGNLGPPALSLLGRGHELYVLELSSFQLETTRALRPAVATVLNLSPDHMDRYRSFDEYVAAKRSVFRGGTVAVANLDDPLARGLGGHERATIGFGTNASTGARWHVAGSGNAARIMRVGRAVMPVDSVPLSGMHNVANVLAAFALGDAVGIDLDAMSAAVEAFTGLPHRCETVAVHRGVRWINDSKGTNVGATVAAIDGIGARGPLVLIAGGLGKRADFSPLAEAAARHVRYVVLIGSDAARIGEALRGRTEIRHAPDLATAVDAAWSVARDGESVLFSPACASFDMFENFAVRGDAFRRLVLARIGA